MQVNIFEKKITRWKNNLIDISKRNPLINFRDTKTSVIKINTDINEFYDLLTNDKSIKVSAIADINKFLDKDKKPNKKETDSSSEDDSSLNIYKAIEKLEKALQSIRLKAKSSIDEKGVNTLFLAFGQLVWKESTDSKVDMKSPLLLLPVTLWREKSDKPYYIDRYNDDLTVNPTLNLKLLNDFGIELPSLPENTEDINILDYINEVKEVVHGQLDWSVNDNTYIGFFSFSKLVMYKDLEQNSESISQHHIIQQLTGAESRSTNEADDTEITIREYDRKINSIDKFQILDADSSQQEAILAAKMGKSFIISGPPGTGKSQTISNIISENLALGKRILFVSEKKAALEVVKKRLDAVDLGDFCLELHSNTTNKKTLLAELNRSLLQQVNFKSSNFSFDNFDRIKNHLNEYTDALHTKIDPLGVTPFMIHGALSRLDSVDDLIFSIDHVDEVKQTSLDEIKELLERLKIYSGVLHDSETHIWKGSSVSKFTLELQSDISVKFKRLSEVISKIVIEINKCLELCELDWKSTFETVENLKSLNLVLNTVKKTPVDWLTDKQKIDDASKIYDQVSSVFQNYNQHKNSINIEYVEEILATDFYMVLSDIETKKSSITKLITPECDYVNDLFTECKSKFTNLFIFYSNVQELVKVKQDLLNQFSININDLNYVQLQGFEEILGKFNLNMKPAESWFYRENFTQIREKFTLAKEKFIRYKEDFEVLNNKYNSEIIQRDELSGMLDRFMIKYSTPFRIFNNEYRRDKKIINFYLKNKNKLSFDELLEDVKLFDHIIKLKKWIEAEDQNFRTMFGELYNGINTDWEEVLIQINHFEVLIQLIHNHGLNVNLFKEHILSNNQIKMNSFEKISDRLRNAFNNVNDNFQEVQLTIPSAKDLEINSIFNVEFLSDLDEVIKQSEQLIFDSKKISAYSRNSSYESYDDFITKVNDLIFFKKAYFEATEMTDLCMKTFEFLFNGFETNLDEISDAIEWVRKLHLSISGAIPNPVIQDIKSGNQLISSNIEQCIININEFLHQNQDLFNFYYGIFNRETIFDNGDTIYSIELDEFASKLNSWALESYKLEEWTAVQSIIRDSESLGIQDFVNEVKLLDVHNNVDYYSLFMKRFYKLWLDYAYDLIPILQNFDSSQHNKLIDQFKSMDKSQFQVNSTRIKSILNKNKGTCLSDNKISIQLSILRREFSKKTRHKPIRKLFVEVPDVLFALKPCMMMSPMSVSQFIDPNVLQFDLVIFDEASQLCTEDAIGSIFRGKQVVIAGDNKQLPPTKFFGASFEEDEEFLDEEDESNDIYESVLDEASIFMPAKPLLWHYRSKHESLIAFSNREIYDNKLYTFPSSSNGKNDGISLVYVPDGVYERSTSRRNIVEAKKVASLVFEHIEKTPDRSLGVIAFSEAQQQAILDQIYELRKANNNPKVEAFFEDNKSDYFFVKNLENVQGDERDTIFFSIGYGKDSNGIIYYNFGPLNKPGGERRLNVAITRAKYEIKLISSILYSDLDDSKLTKRGPQLLKSYLYYASTGGEFVPNVGIQNDGEFDSPFEKDVYESLTAAGYIVKKQIGCSNYRIDLAVVSSKNPGKYILGIECDGAMYHSSKTARDRDRLRQEVLESLGWKIHRIWSQDWFKRKRQELERITSVLKMLNDE